MTLEIARDWLDYVQAAGVFVSLLLAGGALAYAKKSADAASDSATDARETARSAADQAEQTRELLRLASIQHERLVEQASRRPAFAQPDMVWQTSLAPDDLSINQQMQAGVIDLSSPVGEHVELWPVLVRTRITNSGDKPADQVLVRVVVPNIVTTWITSPSGEHPQDVDRQDEQGAALETPDGPVDAYAHAWRIAHLPPSQPESTHILFAFPKPGDYQVVLEAHHEEAGAVSERFVITVADANPYAAQPAIVSRFRW
jgi:hypothetical protein